MSKIITQKCKIENCDGKGKIRKSGYESFIKGYCIKHYERYRKCGDANVIKQMRCQGRIKNKLYNLYKNMKSRCYNKNSKQYPNYGGRDIIVCDRWLGIYGFSNFIEDMGERPEGYSLDRIDNNKGYSPNNCRWATPHQQASNKRNNNKYVGISYHKKKKMYVATLKINNLLVINKGFKTYEEAIECRRNAEKEYSIKI